MYFVSFDINFNKIRYALVDDKGHIYDKSEYDTPTNTKESFYMEIIKIVNNYCLLHEISGICISLEAIVDSKKGIVLDPRELKLLENVNLKEELEELLLIDVLVENSAKCAANAEIWMGKAKKYKDIIYISIDDVVGGAIIKNKKIHHGSDYLAGEFGMMLITNCSEELSTWEDLVSLSKLENKIRKFIETDNYSIFDCCNIENVEIKKEFNKYYFNLAIGILNLYTIYNPEIIIIGGKITKDCCLSEKLESAFKGILTKNNFIKEIPRIELNGVLEDANLIGALYSFLYL